MVGTLKATEVTLEHNYPRLGRHNAADKFLDHLGFWRRDGPDLDGQEKHADASRDTERAAWIARQNDQVCEGLDRDKRQGGLGRVFQLLPVASCALTD